MECTDEKDERKIEKITRKSICLSIYLYTRKSICLSIYLYIYLYTILLNLTLSASVKKKKLFQPNFRFIKPSSEYSCSALTKDVVIILYVKCYLPVIYVSYCKYFAIKLGWIHFDVCFLLNLNKITNNKYENIRYTYTRIKFYSEIFLKSFFRHLLKNIK